MKKHRHSRVLPATRQVLYMQSPSLRQGYLAAIATLLLWSSFMLVSRLGGKSALTGFDLLALRLVTASVLLVLLAPLPARASPAPACWR